MEAVKNIISNFDSIDLVALEKSALLNRTDTKFVFSMHDLTEVLPLLKEFYNVLDINGVKLNTYKTLYFDTPDCRFYHQHHNGKNGRYKVRIRNYVESGIYFLEVKYKHKGRTIKKRIPVNGFEKELSAKSINFLQKTMKDEYAPLEAKLWNSFQRLTLSNKESEERLTIDIGLQFEWKDQKITFENVVIAELKQPRINYRSPFYKIIKTRRIRPLSMSKYCVGLIFIQEALGEQIKSNTFKARILKLNKIGDARVA